MCLFSGLIPLRESSDPSSGSLSPRKSKTSLGGTGDSLLASGRNCEDGARIQTTSSSKEASGMSPEFVSASSNASPSPGNKGLPGKMQGCSGDYRLELVHVLPDTCKNAVWGGKLSGGYSSSNSLSPPLAVCPFQSAFGFDHFALHLQIELSSWSQSRGAKKSWSDPVL